MAAVGNLGVEQLRQLACDRLVLLHSPLQHRARPAVARCDKEINLLASADEAVACVVSVQHHKARRADWVEWKADVHLGRRASFAAYSLPVYLYSWSSPTFSL